MYLSNNNLLGKCSFVLVRPYENKCACHETGFTVRRIFAPFGAFFVARFKEVMQIYFTEKEHRAFERLMKGKPGFDHYNSNIAGADEDCRTCRSYRPVWKDRFCEYQECPFAPGRSTARASPGGGMKEDKHFPARKKKEVK